MPTNCPPGCDGSNAPNGFHAVKKDGSPGSKCFASEVSAARLEAFGKKQGGGKTSSGPTGPAPAAERQVGGTFVKSW